MFFAVDLLIPQHGGKFALAWLAATRGIGHTAKKEIVKCDIAKLCDEILEMVQSSSTRPRLRLSLSLASRLINGVTRIYRAQVEVFKDDVISFLTMVRKPVVDISLSQGSGETVVTPVTRPQRKRKRRTIQFSEEPTGLPTSVIDNFTTLQVVVDEEELARPPAHLIDSDSITLREELPIRPHDQMVLEFEEELQTFPRVLQDAPVLPLPMPVTREKRKTRGTLPKTTAEVTDIPVEEIPLHEFQTIHDIPLQPEVQSIVEIPLQPEIQIVPHINVEQVADMQQDQIQIVPEALESAIHKDVQQVPVAVEIIPPKTKKPQTVDKLTYRPIMRHRVLINRCTPGELKQFNVMELVNQNPVQLIKDESANLCSIVEHSMMRTQAIEDIIMEAPLSAKSRESLLRSSALFQSHIPRRGLSAKQDGTPVPDIHITPIIPQEAYQIVTHADVHVAAAQQDSLQRKEIMEPQFPSTMIERFEVSERTVHPLAESTQVQPMYIDEQITIHPPERTIEIELPPAAVAPSRKAVVKSSNEVEKGKMLTKDRQKRVRDIIKNWNTQMYGPVTLEDVCIQPVNRLNIATAFSDLLSLHKMGYVKLCNKPDSLELGLIEKGERLLKKK